MTDRTQDAEATDLELEQVQQTARTMLKALITIAHDLNTPIALRGMAFAVIAQAEKAGITTGEDE